MPEIVDDRRAKGDEEADGIRSGKGHELEQSKIFMLRERAQAIGRAEGAEAPHDEFTKDLCCGKQ